jgi:hypothetical protein
MKIQIKGYAITTKKCHKTERRLMLQKHISQYSDEELQAWIQQLVDDKTPENVTIEYKSEEAFSEKSKLEIAKDISAFANTKGGIVIYGMPEESVGDETEELAIPRSEYGTKTIPNFVSRMENILIDTISPHLPDIWIREVPILEKPSLRVYVVWHPESWLKPHMVEGYQELRYYRRGLRRTIKMTETEVRDVYVTLQRNIEKTEQFLDANEVNYLRSFFPPGKSVGQSVSQAVSCPQLLFADRVNYSEAEMRQWLIQNLYPRTGLVTWYPSIHGVQCGSEELVLVPSTAGQQTLRYWVELHRNGAINVLWRTSIFKREETYILDWGRELGILWDFIRFNKNFHTRIRYYGPLRFRFSMSNLAFVELRLGELEDPLVARLPDNAFKADLVEDSARLFENPADVLRTFANCLFKAYGLWEAPKLDVYE